MPIICELFYQISSSAIALSLTITSVLQHFRSSKPVGYVMKRVCLFHRNAAQVALSAKKALPPVILIVFSEYHQDLVKRALFVLRELLITLHPAG